MGGQNKLNNCIQKLNVISKLHIMGIVIIEYAYATEEDFNNKTFTGIMIYDYSSDLDNTPHMNTGAYASTYFPVGEYNKPHSVVITSSIRELYINHYIRDAVTFEIQGVVKLQSLRLEIDWLLQPNMEFLYQFARIERLHLHYYTSSTAVPPDTLIPSSNIVELTTIKILHLGLNFNTNQIEIRSSTHKYNPIPQKYACVIKPRQLYSGSAKWSNVNSDLELAKDVHEDITYITSHQLEGDMGTCHCGKQGVSVQCRREYNGYMFEWKTYLCY